MTANLEVRLALVGDDLLGEGPVWEQESQRLLRVDIARGLVHSWWPETGRVETLDAGGRVSLAVPTTSGGLCLAVEDRIVLVRKGVATTVCRVEAGRDSTRLNDGACDGSGRLWVGTYSLLGDAEAGLYCVDSSGEVRRVLAGMIASNGLAWTPDGQSMYVTDTGARQVTRYRFHADGPALTDGHVVCELAADDGLPDGIAVDADGGLWVAVFGGGVVRRYTGDGMLVAEAQLPVTYPTSLAFGGPELDRLFVTTARHRLSDNERATQPQAGGVFEVAAGRRAAPTHAFDDSMIELGAPMNQ